AAGLSAPLVAASRSAVYLSLLPALVPLLLTLILAPSAGMLPGSAHLCLRAALAAVFLLVLLRLTLNQNDSLALLLAVRFNNEDLVQQLRSQIEVAARANPGKNPFTPPGPRR